MATYLGQMGTPQPSIADSLNLFAQQIQQRKMAQMKMAQDAISSGQYAPGGQAQPMGLLGKIGYALSGPQVGGANMNVGGQNFQFQTPQLQAQQQAQKLQAQVEALKSSGLLGNTSGTAPSNSPFETNITMKDGNLDLGLKQTDPAKKLTMQKDQMEIDKMKRDAQSASGINQIGNGVIDDGTKSQDQLLAEMKQKDPGKLKLYENIKAGNVNLTGRAPAKLLPIFQAMSSLYGKQFDQQAIAVRAKLKQDYSPAGKTGQNAVSLNTAIQHLSELQKIIPQLKDSGIKPWNQLMQTMGREFGPGSNVLAKYRATKVALSGELSNIYKRSGGTDTEIKNVADTLDSADSPEAQSASIEEAVKLMTGRLAQNIDGWKATFDLPDDPKLPSNIITPRSIKTLNDMGLGYIVENTLKEDESAKTNSNSVGVDYKTKYGLQ